MYYQQENNRLKVIFLTLWVILQINLFYNRTSCRGGILQ